MIAEVSLTPIGSGTRVTDAVAKAVRIIRASGLRSQLNPMGTVIEGGWDEVLAVVRRCHDALLEDHERLSILIKIDARRGPQVPMEHKVEAVEERLRDPGL